MYKPSQEGSQSSPRCQRALASTDPGQVSRIRLLLQRNQKPKSVTQADNNPQMWSSSSLCWTMPKIKPLRRNSWPTRDTRNPTEPAHESCPKVAGLICYNLALLEWCSLSLCTGGNGLAVASPAPWRAGAVATAGTAAGEGVVPFVAAFFASLASTCQGEVTKSMKTIWRHLLPLEESGSPTGKEATSC